jgi:hypothetical protein
VEGGGEVLVRDGGGPIWLEEGGAGGLVDALLDELMHRELG